ncbi:rhomboid family intramembrane serine protease [Flavobacterium sp.]|uniref:rhomboid family intramembrane serine protease n=1 Tax=Flavobacterium sp. TaxID=239 RepID=UPI003D0D725A
MEVFSFLLIVINVYVSYKGLSNRSFFENYKFEVDKILINKDYIRLVSSGFLHINWVHLVFNMLTLYSFSGLIETKLGGFGFLLIYFSSLIGGDLLSLFIHKNHGDYSSVGASGAVSGIVFASIALFPGLDLNLFGSSLAIPSWLYGILYVMYSIYGIKSQKDNIGHDAHLGGALLGMLVALGLLPSAIEENLLVIIILILPILTFIYLIVTKPNVLLIDNFYFKKQKKYLSIDDKYNSDKKEKEKQIDSILEKISEKGINSLSSTEKMILDEYSQKIN